MGVLSNGIQNIRNFLAEVIGEARKTEWPGREELIESTVVVIVSVVLLSVFVGASDKMLVYLLKAVVP